MSYLHAARFIRISSVVKFLRKNEEYKKMRDNGEPDDILAQALIHDDLESIQKNRAILLETFLIMIS